jgi:hypothetical protein
MAKNEDKKKDEKEVETTEKEAPSSPKKSKSNILILFVPLASR